MKLSEIALGVVEDIDRNGLFEGEGPLWTSDDDAAKPCCILANPHVGINLFDMEYERFKLGVAAEILGYEPADDESVFDVITFFSDKNDAETVKALMVRVAEKFKEQGL